MKRLLRILQKEIEEDTGIRFGIVEKHQFAALPVVKADGSTGMLGFEESAAIFDHLKSQGFVDAKGKVQDTLRAALKDGSFALPTALEPHLALVRDVLKKVAGRLDIKNADERIVVKTRQAKAWARGAVLRVERAGGLVGQHKAGIVGERTRDRDPLALHNLALGNACAGTVVSP